MNNRLSKSRYQLGLQCPKALWFEVHRRDLKAPITENQQHIFDTGHEVGRLAQRLFPGGVEIDCPPYEVEEALSITGRLIAEGARVLYEPAFVRDGVLVRVDVLVKTGDTTWDLYEVKSTASVKPQHVTDAAIQTWVAEGGGLSIGRTNVVHIDTGYVYEGGDIDLSAYFSVNDVTAAVRDYIPEIPAQVESFHRLIAGSEPQVICGAQCMKPYECAYLSQCVVEADDVTPTGEPDVDVEGLSAALASLGRPLYFLDFETYMSAIPLHRGTRPYQQIPMQYSLHRLDTDGALSESGYLHRNGADPRRELAERLIADVGSHGPVLQYSSYERTMLRGLAVALPDLADALEGIIDRLVDLERIVKRHAVHPAARGRTSIKYVLPAFCPDMSYADEAIGDGKTASNRYLRAITGRLEPSQAEQVFADLESYCGLDTLAMVRLHEALGMLVRADAGDEAR